MKRLLLVLALCVLPAPAQTPWKAGVAKVKITPTESIWLAGYGARTKPSEGVLQDIYAKALALEDAQGNISVLVTADLLGFNREMSDAIAEGVRKKNGLSRDRLVLNASHTHSAPVTGNLLRPAYALQPEQEAVIRNYTVRLIGQVIDLIGAAIQNLAPAQLSFEQGLAGFAVNRRRVTLRHLPGPVEFPFWRSATRGAPSARWFSATPATTPCWPTT